MGRWLSGSVQALWECLQILEVTGPAMHPSLTPHLLLVLPGLVGCCWHAHAGIHHSAASSAVAVASAKAGDVLPALLRCDSSKETYISPFLCSLSVACPRMQRSMSKPSPVAEALANATPGAVLARCVSLACPCKMLNSEVRSGPFGFQGQEVTV